MVESAVAMLAPIKILSPSVVLLFVTCVSTLPLDDGWEESSGSGLTAAAKLHGFSGNYGLGGALGGLTLNDMGYDLTDSFTSASHSVGISLGLPLPEQTFSSIPRPQFFSPELPLPPPQPTSIYDHTLVPGSSPLNPSAGPVVQSLTHLIPKFESLDQIPSTLSSPLVTEPVVQQKSYGFPPSSIEPLSVFKNLWDTDISEVLHTDDSRLEQLSKSAAFVAGPPLQSAHTELAAPVLVEKKEPSYASSRYKFLPLDIGERLSTKLSSSGPISSFKYNFKAEAGPKVSGYTSHVIHEPKPGSDKGYGQSSVSFTMVHGVPSKLATIYKQDFVQPVIPEITAPIVPLELEQGYDSEIIKKYDQDLSGGYGSSLTGSFGSILTNEYGGVKGLEFLYKKKK